MADILPFTPAESAFDRDLRAERYALHERYDPSPRQLRDARAYERIAEPTDYPVGVRFVDEPRLYTRDEVMFALFIGVFIGAMLTVAIAWMVAFL